MATLLHGYLDPTLPELDETAINEMNSHAAKDFANRSLPGGVIIFCALLISALSSPIINDYPQLSYILFSCMAVILLLRLYVAYIILRQKYSLTITKIFTYSIFFLSSAIWGCYIGLSWYWYGPVNENMVLMMFNIGIAAGAGTGLFIWLRLTHMYLFFLLFPVTIAGILNWHIESTGILFGLTAYFIYLYIQSKRFHAEYWRALQLNKLLTRQAEELVEAKEEAEQASHAKSEFLSSMSHELRTPLNAIHGFTQLLNTDKETPPTADQKESLDHILKASDHLLTLINQVLDLAKIEAGKMALDIKTINLNEVIQECLPLIYTLAEEKNVTLDIASLPDNTLVSADRMRLKQILINLLSNGVKYNKRDGLLDLTFSFTENGIVIRLADTGIGISKAHQQEMFQSFSRLGQENSSIQGSGVGLAITKNLLEAMNCELFFESEEHQGSVFWFELPLSQT